MEFLKGVESLKDVPVYWEAPKVGVDLPVLSGEAVHVEPLEEREEERMLFGRRICEVRGSWEDRML
jgi:hypothetical protein